MSASEVGFTKGPWRASSAAPEDYAMSIIGVDQVDGGGWPVIADVCIRTRHGSSKANGELLAAAPEMHGILVARLAELDWKEGLTESEVKERTAIFNVLAKIGGKS